MQTFKIENAKILKTPAGKEATTGCFYAPDANLGITTICATKDMFSVQCAIAGFGALQAGFSSEDDAQAAINFAETIIKAININIAVRETFRD